MYAGRPDVTKVLIDSVVPLILGADPFEHEILRHHIYAETGMAHLGTRGMSWALSGLDMALWDLVGRIMGQPLHRVWGSAWRTQVPFYGDIPQGSRRRWPRARGPGSCAASGPCN